MEKINQYFSHFRIIQDNLWFKIAFSVWWFSTVYDQMLSQWIPEKFSKQAPKAWEVAIMTGNILPFWGWLLILAGILVIASFEYGIRQTNHQVGEPTIVAKDKNLSGTRKKLIFSFIFIISMGVILIFDYLLYQDKMSPKEIPIQQKQIEQKIVPPQPVIKETPSVYEPFRSAYEIHKPKLGKRIEGPKLINSSFEVHENAIVIWPSSLPKVYLLKEDNSLIEYAQPVFDTDPKWASNKWLTKHFCRTLCPQKGLKPPYSQVASSWDKDEKSWSWIGLRRWDCYYAHIYYQKFEHGIIIGSFSKWRETKNKDYDELFILFDDSRWESQQSETLRTGKCIQSPDEVENVFEYELDPASTITDKNSKFPP